MRKDIHHLLTATLALALCAPAAARGKVLWFQSTASDLWHTSTLALESRPACQPDATLNPAKAVLTFKGWGICFNELGWDALRLLPADEQTAVIRRLFSPTGDLRFTIGRIPLGANDYARGWYSCDETDGDFDMAHFTIDRDKQTLIPFIHMAQKEGPALTCWISPWSPPAWMKTNKHYANRSGAGNGLAADRQVPLYTDQFIQEPRYLQAYALYFNKFIDAYAAEGIPITAVCYQNEAYSYTVYPSCSWSNAGASRFIYQYLGPRLAKTHPEVELWLGTMNVADPAVFDEILKPQAATPYVKAIGYQWEGGQALPVVRQRHPAIPAVQTESECGSGTFDWAAADHTFQLINHYLAGGCQKYTYWNPILKDDGSSTWGWRQNALLRVNSAARTCTLTPEYYAMKHYTHFVAPGSALIASQGGDRPMTAFRTPAGAVVVVVENTQQQPRAFTFSTPSGTVRATLKAKSFNTFVCGSRKVLGAVMRQEPTR
jgi:glucosylceramidase